MLKRFQLVVSCKSRWAFCSRNRRNSNRHRHSEFAEVASVLDCRKSVNVVLSSHNILVPDVGNRKRRAWSAVRIQGRIQALRTHLNVRSEGSKLRFGEIERV